MKKQKIVIDGVIFGLQSSGGISREWAQLLLYLDKSVAKEAHIFILMPPNQNVEWAEVQPKLQNLQILPRRKMRWGRKSFFKESLYLTKLALRLRPDIWHTTYFVGLPFWFAKQKVVPLYDMIPEIFHLASPYEADMKYQALKKSHTLIAISHHTAQDLGKFYPEWVAKTQVIPLSFSTTPVLKVPQKEPYFVYVGRRAFYKNFLPAIVQILKDERFTDYAIQVIGGEEKWSPEEKETFEKLGVSNRVVHQGLLSFPEVQKRIANSSALLYPSLYEGFGIPILEAFYHEVPLLAYRTSSITEVAGEEYPLADVDSSSSLCDTLEQLLKEKDVWTAYGKERVKLYSPEKEGEAFYNFYLKRSCAL